MIYFTTNNDIFQVKGEIFHNSGALVIKKIHASNIFP